jgi:hypothetical protein
MIAAFSLFVLCQLTGEVLVRLAKVPVPGPVVGIVLLVCYLSWREEVSDSVQDMSRGLLTHCGVAHDLEACRRRRGMMPHSAPWLEPASHAALKVINDSCFDVLVEVPPVVGRVGRGLIS